MRMRIAGMVAVAVVMMGTGAAGQQPGTVGAETRGTISVADFRQQVAQQQARNIRLTFHLIEADGFDTVDPAIAEIVAELRTLFRFDGYRLLDTSLLTGVVAGNGDSARETSVVRQRLALGDRGTFDLEAYIERTANREGARIHVELQDVFNQASVMATSVNIRDGQTIVLGSGRPGTIQNPSSGATALILVMSADIEPFD